MATTDVVVAKPLIYNGSLTTYASWRRSITLYMTVNQTKFPDDNTKIACALATFAMVQSLWRAWTVHLAQKAGVVCNSLHLLVMHSTGTNRKKTNTKPTQTNCLVSTVISE